MWKNLYLNSFVKEQAYTYSCFPCSLHMALINLGYKTIRNYDEDDSIEIFFNEACKVNNGRKSLDKVGPTSVEQLFKITDDYLAFAGINLRQSNRFYIKKGTNAIHTGALLRWNNEPYYAAIIANYDLCGHATLLIKNGDKFVHIHTSKTLDTLKSSTNYGDNLRIVSPAQENEYWGICFHGIIKKEEEPIVGGEVLFIFK